MSRRILLVVQQLHSWTLNITSEVVDDILQRRNAVCFCIFHSIVLSSYFHFFVKKTKKKQIEIRRQQLEGLTKIHRKDFSALYTQCCELEGHLLTILSHLQYVDTNLPQNQSVENVES